VEAAPFWAAARGRALRGDVGGHQYWVPLMLAGKSFTAFFTFEGEKMLTRESKCARRCCIHERGRVFRGGLRVSRRGHRAAAGRGGMAVTGCTHSPASAEALAASRFRWVSGILPDARKWRAGPVRGGDSRCQLTPGGPEEYRAVMSRTPLLAQGLRARQVIS